MNQSTRSKLSKLREEVWNLVKECQSKGELESSRTLFGIAESLTKELSRHDQDSSNGSLPEVPTGLPLALVQVLEVVFLVRNGRPRIQATQRVARLNLVARETVQDKYTRQLSIGTREFDRLLEEPGLNSLRQRLKNKFPAYSPEIDRLLSRVPK